MSKNIRNRVVVVTGGIGSGKSTVCAIFESLGAKIVSADELSRTAAEQSKEEIIKEFPGVYTDKLDRKKLADIVFKNSKKRKLLESILHPKIQQLADAKFKEFSDDINLVIYECPLFFEAGMQVNDYKAVIVVASNQENTIKRIIERDKSELSSIHDKINSQLPLTEKVSKATYIINNDGDLEDLKYQVKTIFQKLA